MLYDKNEILNQLSELIGVVNDLREKCPWDRKQTFESLRLLTIEEVYELSESILNRNAAEIKIELGDLLLHIILYSRLAAEKEWFTLSDICKSLVEKLKYRHPHIYGTTEVSDSEDVEKNWEKLKLNGVNRNKSVLSGVPPSLPSTVKAIRIQQKARSAGFDWEKPEQVWDKVEEEFKELKEELTKKNNRSQEKIEDEFGDLLFSVINAGRLYGIDPDTALEKTNRKFILRFNYLEKEVLKKNINLHDMSINEIESFWQKAKNRIATE